MQSTEDDAKRGWGPPPGGIPRMGVALAQFCPPSSLPDDLAVSLQIGDRLKVEKQTEEWYYGMAPMGKWGLFPKSFVHLMDQDEKESPFVDKIESALREWEQFAIDKFKSK